MNFIPLQNLIPRAAAKKGIANEFKAISVCSAFESIIQEFFPEYGDVHDKIRVRYFKDGTLTLGVASSTLASSIMIRKAKILTALNEKLQNSMTKTIVKDVRTTVY